MGQPGARSVESFFDDLADVVRPQVASSDAARVYNHRGIIGPHEVLMRTRRPSPATDIQRLRQQLNRRIVEIRRIGTSLSSTRQSLRSAARISAGTPGRAKGQQERWLELSCGVGSSGISLVTMETLCDSGRSHEVKEQPWACLDERTQFDLIPLVASLAAQLPDAVREEVQRRRQQLRGADRPLRAARILRQRLGF